MRISSILLILCLVFASQSVFGQRKKKVKYAPVENISREEAWPIVAQAIAIMNVVPASFDYGKGILKTGFYTYKKGIVPNRGKFLFQLKDNTLHIEMVDLELKEANTGKWVPTYPDPLFPAEKRIKGEVAQAIRMIHAEPEGSTKANEQFASNLLFHAFFFETASELAGDIWFKQFLAGKTVSWNMPFTDIQKAADSELSYAEHYTVPAGSSELHIVRYTNSDAQVFTNKGANAQVTGTCKSVSYADGKWTLKIEG